MKKLLFVSAVLAMALTVSLPGAFARTDGAAAPRADPGLANRQILIGGTFPLTGPASLYAPIPKGMDAYFKWVNQRKGLTGSAGSTAAGSSGSTTTTATTPPTIQLTNQLVLQDKVFAIVGTLGTEPNIDPAAPQPAQGSAGLRLDRGELLGASVQAVPVDERLAAGLHREGIAYGRWIARNAPNAKIAAFYQNDDYGKDYLKGLKIGLAAKRLIVSELGYEITDTSAGSQIARQRASGADTWVMLTTPTPTVRAIATAKALNYGRTRS